MDFDEYWHQLVDREDRGEVLSDAEDRFFRLSCIYGETMVDGIEAYFERRWAEYPADMAILRECGFSDIAESLDAVRRLIFGDSALDEETVNGRIDLLLDETDEVRPILIEIDKIYQQLIPRLEALNDGNYQFGLEQGFYLGGDV